MGTTNLHPELDTRVAALAARIATLKDKTNQANHPEKSAALKEIAELEQRHKVAEDQLHELHGQGPDFGLDLKVATEKMAGDLAVTVEDFMTWIDSDYRPDRRPKPMNKQ